MAMGTDDGSALTGNPIPDCYGSITQTADTPITRVIAPSAGKKARVSAWSYKAGTTAHVLTTMPTVSDTKVASDAAAGQAVVAFTTLPQAPDGSVIAANDWVVLQYEDGTWDDHKVSSVSAFNITMTANLAKKVKAGTRVFFMGAPADHTDRQFTLVASTVMNANDSNVGLGSASRTGEPILIHIDNATAAGTLYFLSFTYV